jgi:glyoxylase-like metal-dependent hydrolase (beta-lactamase superfamily II)
MNYKKIDFESNYFDLFEIADGIYAAMSKNDSGASVSAGFFDLGNYIIIFDTHSYPGAARDLYNAVKKLYGKEPSFIVNSHFHSDHIFGNCLFPETIPIISTPITLNKIKEVGFDRLKHFQETAEEEVKKRKEMLYADNPPFGEQEIYNDLEFYKYVTDPNFKIRLPDFLINNDLIINGAEKTVHLIPQGSGHTDSDIIAYFPNEKICFMGDLLFADLDDSWAPNETGRFYTVDPPNLYKILESLIKKDIEIYIPGHGELSTKNEVQMNMDFIKKYYLKD